MRYLVILALLFIGCGNPKTKYDNYKIGECWKGDQQLVKITGKKQTAEGAEIIYLYAKDTDLDHDVGTEARADWWWDKSAFEEHYKTKIDCKEFDLRYAVIPLQNDLSSLKDRVGDLEERLGWANEEITNLKRNKK